MSTYTARQKFADEKRPAVEAALDLIDGVKFKGVPPASAKSLFPATMLQAGVDEDYKNGAFAFDDGAARDVAWPLRTSMLVNPAAYESTRNIVGVRSLSMKEAKGRIKRPMPRMVEYVHTAWRGGRKTGTGATQIYGWFPGKPAVNISTQPGMEEQYARRIIDITAGWQMTLDDYWTVVIGDEAGTSSIKVPCSAKSAMDFLSLRDVPSGNKRRSAIRHWVTDHDRATPSGGEAPVKGHLRGREAFTWDGLKGYVEPSRTILDRIK